jgi:hypothetical protein
LQIVLFFLPTAQSAHETLTLGRVNRFSLFPEYRIPNAIRNAHTHVIGRSGMGKSKFLEFALYQDIASARGCGLIDPHSLLIDDLLRLLLTRNTLTDLQIRRKIIYVDPSRTDYVVPFNVLATEHDVYDKAASILEAFRRTWPDALREAPHFSNVVTAALLVLIQNKLTLMDMPRLLTNQEFREQCLQQVTDRHVVEFWQDRYDRWGREAPLMRESTLNKVGAFQLNPRLKLMLGQRANHLDFRRIMDEGHILLVDLGRSDSETNRLIGSLIVTGFELAMRRRQQQHLFNLTIDEFAGYVANEGSATTLAHVFSEGRKFKLGMTVAHQNLSQLTPRMTDALGDVGTKVIFGVNRQAAEHLAKVIGQVDTEAIKRDPKTDTQHELFSSLGEQWEAWTQRLQSQGPRQMTVASQDQVVSLRSIPIPTYQASDVDVEAVRQESLSQYGIPYHQAVHNIQAAEAEMTPPEPAFSEAIP